MRAVAFLGLGVAVGVVGVLFAGGSVYGCLGPIGVTAIQCLDSQLRHDPAFVPGPDPIGVALMAFGGVLVILACLPARVTRQVAGLVLVATLLGAAGGALVYEPTREHSRTGPIDNGTVISVNLPASQMALVLDAVVGATIAGALAGLWLRSASRRPAPGNP